MAKQFLLVLLCLVSGFACRKFELPEPTGHQSPVFYAKGDAEGESFVYAADGVNRVAESGYEVDSVGVYTYYGKLVSIECTEGACESDFEIAIRGYQNMDDFIQQGPLEFREPKRRIDQYEEYKATLSPDAMGPMQTCEWIIEGKSYTTIGNAPLVLTRTEFDSTYIDVLLVAYFANACSDTIFSRVYLPSHGCSASVSVESTGTQFIYEAVPVPDGAYTYTWQFEGGVTASSKQVKYTYTSPPSDGVESLQLTVSNNACSAKSVRNQLVDSSLADCIINLNSSFETKVITVYDTLGLDLRKVEVLYKNAIGIEYSTAHVMQPSNAKFEIIQTKDYRDKVVNPTLRSKMIKGTLTARFSNGQDSIMLENVEFVMPLGLGL